MVREHEIHAATMYVKLIAKILPAHSGTFAVPAGESIAPGAWPTHDVLWLCLLPQCEISLILLLTHTSESITTGILQVLQCATREYAVLIVLIVFLDVEIYRTVADVCVAIVQYLLHQLLLLYDMTSGMWLDRWWKHVEFFHRRVEATGIVLCYLHWFQLFQASLLGYLVLALVCVVLQMAYIGNVSHVAHLVAQMLQVAEENIEGDGWTCVSQMCIAINGRTADIHAYVSRVDWFERFLLSCQRVVYQ